MKSKVDKLDVDELVPVPVDLSKQSDVVKNDVVKKDVYNAKIKNIEDKIPVIINLATNDSLNVKINEVKGEIALILLTQPILLLLLLLKIKYLVLVILSQKLTITQKLVKLKK